MMNEGRKDVVAGKEKSSLRLLFKFVWFSDRKRGEGYLRVVVVITAGGGG